ncbi:MAG: hypothetical protein WAZ60_23925 [Desulfosalsimonadaceae bacterium]
METTFVIQNLLGTGAMITAAGVLVNRWMNTVDQRAEKTKADLDAAATKLAESLKEVITEHRDEIRILTKDLDDNLEGIYQQLRIANGRTAKIEGGLLAVERVCAERHGK